MTNIQPGFIGRFLQRIKDFFVTDVPAELDACQNCGKLECSQGKWQNCEHRIQQMKLVEADREKHS
ncbi:MAG: hypothetical protein KJO69_06185 [Gammaproteobacteria bacterium]|nr:hypothetical protein [Gammaproteobacteria bacterium]NNJ71981.1 hypothetical protein [Enterobacterales bacterium]